MVAFAFSLVIVLFSCLMISSRAITVTPSVACNTEKFGKEDPFRVELHRVLADLVRLTPMSNSLKHHSSGSYSVFGFAQCSKLYIRDVCKSCLEGAVHIIHTHCGRTIGAQVEMDDVCFIRYENHKF
ncbi:antifungal protein ginkbilobin-like protein [Dioscorea cayenensis subsp. rotundata]|uniref:Antifungal protein ginkbilobin-like protein n=1 Tax=Dioscorea cayennensis subsp. rotundata TaxID=55577 RepID=A0AB40AFT0_DIOCR|nr:antifungal protein ginkbilobin-like protein [Dioscorea cayenensis subsp. rotundata]